MSSQRTVSNNAIMSDLGELADYTTVGDAYAEAGSLACILMRTKHFAFTGADKALLVKVLGSIDDGTTYPFEAVAEFEVGVGATVTKTVTTFYSNLQVQAKPKDAGQNGTLSTQYGLSTI